MDLEDIIEGTVNSIAIVFFIGGFVITYLIFIKKKKATTLLQLILFTVGSFYCLGEVLEAFTTWYDADEFGDFFAVFLSMIILVVSITAFFEQKLSETERELFLLNKELEKKIEERTKDLRASEENYRNLVNNILDVIFELNSNKKISYVSPQIKILTSYQPVELLEHKLSEIIHEDDIEFLKRSFDKTFETGENARIECRMRNKTGKYIQVSIIGSLVAIDSELKIIGIIRDISDQKKAERMIKEQIEKLKEIDQIRSDFVRRTSHELKTPLISIYTSSKYLLDTYKEELNEEILKLIKVINRGGTRLKNLTENLLDVYDLESKKIELRKQRINITKTVKECINDFELSFKERELFLKTDLDEDIYINIDKIRIEHVILNLLSNAIKNTPPNGIIYVSLNKEKTNIDITIKDTGIGFTKDERDIAFKKFGKIERQIQGKDIIIEGSGLGLYISNEIVKLHEGKIILESEGRDKGSTFIIRLPI